MPTRLSPISKPAADLILVGDPRRSFLLAQELTEAPKMSHLARGLWGYTGGAPSGRPVTIQSTGIGGSSAATVISDLAGSGVSRIVRLGTCFAIQDGLPAGTVVFVTSAIGKDGASRTVSREKGESARFFPDARLSGLLEGLGTHGTVSSHDLVVRNDPDVENVALAGADGTFPESDAVAVVRDLQTAATFAVADSLSIAAAALLIVSETRDGERIDETGLEPAFLELGRKVLDRISPAERLFN